MCVGTSLLIFLWHDLAICDRVNMNIKWIPIGYVYCIIGGQS